MRSDNMKVIVRADKTPSNEHERCFNAPMAPEVAALIEKIVRTQIDDIIRAELPDPKEDPVLFEIVKKCKIHGPCGLLNLHSP
ncbi:hypothetical protein TNCT_99391 [Trichonephila clavata]|uniref:Uncharacterized protein n=1 Tax=Trichonephila clavata TaxID=2740835 RepID=A0A8X6K9S5_TRICU|nr:hypothetical protein TNCT_99391 [Trichonephila clavata]